MQRRGKAKKEEAAKSEEIGAGERDPFLCITTIIIITITTIIIILHRHGRARCMHRARSAFNASSAQRHNSL
jgi:hypothetical protein